MKKTLLINKPQAILFDLDGTLVDSALDLTEALRHTFITLDLEAPSEKKVSEWIGNGIDKLLHRALTNSINGVASDDDFWRAKNIFFTEYEKQSGNQSKLYLGVEQTLAHFFQENILMACVTNKDRRFTLPLLDKLRIKNHFSMIVCGDDLNNKKPHPEPLIFIANKLNVDIKKCLMVGDSASDIYAANAAEMPVFCVTYGYSQGINLETLKVDAMISDMREIEHYFINKSIKQWDRLEMS